MFSEFLFYGAIAIASVVAGGIASISGFGIGSVLTPIFAIELGTKLAVAAVSVPHVTATALRFWLLRKNLDRRLLWSFGVMSAAGGLAGALLHAYAENLSLTIVFGVLLIFTGLSGLTGLAERMRFHGVMAWAAGLISGALGGMVGNQGGIRAAAMLGFDVSRHAFVATATAVGLIVDGARMPVYLATQGSDLIAHWPAIALATAGVVLGTLLGARVLAWIPESLYRRVVSTLVLCLGAFMLARAAYG